ncbi:hypothetical protein DFH11DRAFT_1542605 [Phellopilus nigrolimitatus]|nr:hypothetical protein DFH11DRAFT_1542605 [Phellopilus nigrolimitatus]
MSSKASSIHSNSSSELQSLLRQCGQMEVRALAARIDEIHAATVAMSSARTSSCAKSATRALQELERRNRVGGQRTRIHTSELNDGSAKVHGRINSTHDRKDIKQRWVPERRIPLPKAEQRFFLRRLHV